jgi:hypothetical protein
VGANQPLAPVENLPVGTTPQGELAKVRLDLMPAALARGDQP